MSSRVPTFCLLAVIIILMSAVGCSSNRRTAHERHKAQELTLNLYTEPPSLDPGLALDTSSGLVISMLFEGLVSPNPDGPPKPGIAQSYTVSDDGLIYTFHLRPSVWSNGTPLTAADFVYAWKRVLEPNFPSDLSYYLFYIKGAQAAKTGKAPLENVGIKAIDDQTLVVTLEHPTPFFIELLLLPPFMPVSKEQVEHDPKWALEAGPQYVCNGPFDLKDWIHSNSLTVQRNPRYWNAQAVRLNEIKLLMVSDSSTELALFDDGTIDWAGKPISIGIPMDSLDALRASGRLEPADLAGGYWYLFNVDRVPFNNANMRRAFAYAINRQEIVTNITKDDEPVATCLVPSSMNPRQQPCFQDGDIETARQLFRKGLEELKLTKATLPRITLIYNSNEGHHKVAQAVQQQWKVVFDINVHLESCEWKVYLDQLAQGDFTIARMSWVAPYNDPHAFLDLFKYRDAQANFTHWEDTRFIHLMDQSLVTKDSSERKKMLAEAEDILIQEMPVIPVYFLNNTHMRRKNLKNVLLGPIGLIDFRYAYFAPEETP